MDFKSMPPKKGYNRILTIVDRLTKMVRLEATKDTTSANETASIVFRKWYLLFGIPKEVTSDRDTLFVSKIWKQIHERLGVKENMTVARNQRANGQVERIHGILADLMRLYPEMDWVDALPLIEFALNDSVNASTGFSPFYLAYGRNMKAIPTLGERGKRTGDLVEEMQITLEEVKERLRKTQDMMFKEANTGRQEGEEFKAGDQVWLEREGINLDALKGIREGIKPRWLGPYLVRERCSDHHYELELPPTMSRIHPRFHRERLKKYRNPRERFPSRTVLERPPADEETGEFEVERILDKRKKYNRVEYLVKWLGYALQDATWEPARELTNCLEKIKDFEESGGDVESRGDSSREGKAWRRSGAVDGGAVADMQKYQVRKVLRATER
jgi:Chromo (CHRromatin Organisation MOdifier) domain